MQIMLIKILNKINKKLNKFIEYLNNKQSQAKNEIGKWYEFVNYCDAGKPVFQIKPETRETVHPFEIFGVLSDISLSVKYPKLEIMEYQSAHFFADADYIILGSKVVWNKISYPMFSKMFPLDKGIVKFDEKRIRLKLDVDEIKLETAFSMCGVHSKIWSHFLVQYLPKLYFLSEYLKQNNEKITVVLPNYDDAHVKEVVDIFLKKIPMVETIILNHNQSVYCEKLIYIESTAMISDHESYETYMDFFVPNCVTRFLKEVFVPECISNYDIKTSTSRNKLYVVRKNASYRNLLNIDEIEEYFITKEFKFIEPHKLTLKEKIELFYNADKIAGPYSAGFSNIVFCRPETKICILSNIQRSFETYLSYFVDQQQIKFVAVTGKDFENDSHSSYVIPIEKVDLAFKNIFN